MPLDNTWRTKCAIQKDIAEVTGNPLADISNAYMLTGDQPPPALYCSSDDEIEEEMRQRTFGSNSHHNYEKMESGVGKPDLDAITVMLRMVQSNDEVNEITPVDNNVASQNPIIISKPLNPHVPDFVPKNNLSECESNISKVKVEKPSSSINNEVKIKSDELKNRIKNAKGNTIEHKYARNVAIAALLKLHSIPNPECSTNDSSQVDTTPRTTPTNVSGTSNEIQKSIDKVNDWFNKPENPVKHAATVGKSNNVHHSSSDPSSSTSLKKATLPILTQITFKKKNKQSVKPKPSENNDIPSIYNKQFVPSEHAQELLKKYEDNERARQAKSRDVVDIFTSLENKLKAKDEEILNRRRRMLVENDRELTEEPSVNTF